MIQQWSRNISAKSADVYYDSSSFLVSEEQLLLTVFLLGGEPRDAIAAPCLRHPTSRMEADTRQSSWAVIPSSSCQRFHSMQLLSSSATHASPFSAPSNPPRPPRFLCACPGRPVSTALPSTCGLVSGRGGGTVGVWPTLCQGPSQRGGTACRQPHQQGSLVVLRCNV